MWLMPCCLRRVIMRVNDGEIGWASLAAISRHVTERVIRQGGVLLSIVKMAKYLSIKLTAR